MAFEREDVFVHGVEHVGGLREEGLLEFVGGRDPVAGADDGRRGVELVEMEISVKGKGYIVRSEAKGAVGKVAKVCGVALPPVLRPLETAGRARTTTD